MSLYKFDSEEEDSDSCVEHYGGEDAFCAFVEETEDKALHNDGDDFNRTGQKHCRL